MSQAYETQHSIKIPWLIEISQNDEIKFAV